MKIFVGFGYNPRDAWIRQLVFPLIRAFGAEVVTGEDVYGQAMTVGDAVKRRIEESDGLIGFLTRRDEQWPTHVWVIQELNHAWSIKLPFVEVRETSVPPQLGVLAEYPRINYEKAKRDRCLIDLATVIGSWSRSVPVVLKLLPEDLVRELRPFVHRHNLRCRYQVRDRGRDLPEVETPIVPMIGGLFIDVRRGSRDSLIRVIVEANDKIWQSDYQPIDSVSIKLDEIL
jgi:hypothetical protein